MPAQFRPIKEYVRIGNRRGLPKFLYHATKKDNLESIRDFGLVRGFLKGVPKWKKDVDFIWLDIEAKYLRKWVKKYYPDWDWVIIRIYTKYLDTDKLYKKSKARGIKWYLYKGDIPPEAISIAG